jgi:hypothetical protein
MSYNNSLQKKIKRLVIISPLSDKKMVDFCCFLVNVMDVTVFIIDDIKQKKLFTRRIVNLKDKITNRDKINFALIDLSDHKELLSLLDDQYRSPVLICDPDATWDIEGVSRIASVLRKLRKYQMTYYSKKLKPDMLDLIYRIGYENELWKITIVEQEKHMKIPVLHKDSCDIKFKEVSNLPTFWLIYASLIYNRTSNDGVTVIDPAFLGEDKLKKLLQQSLLAH